MTTGSEEPKSPSIEPMLIVGREAIAALLATTARHVDELHKRGELPTFKLGRKIAVRREALNDFFAKQEEERLNSK